MCVCGVGVGGGGWTWGALGHYPVSGQSKQRK